MPHALCPMHHIAHSPLPTQRSKLFLILGGARSGKSAFALHLAESIPGKKAYLATGEPIDEEMFTRIKRHKKERGNKWATIEEPVNIANVIRTNKEYAVILLDCLTLWLSNLMHTSGCPSPLVGEGNGGGAFEEEINSLISTCKRSKANIIIVSNEVGLGIVPENHLARRFRDIAGYTNQRIAEVANEVYFVAAGIAMRMK